MTKFIIFIFWLIIIYYAFRLLIRYAFPFLIRYFLKRSQKNYYENHQKSNKKEGEINIDYVPPKNKKDKKNNFGEYIDYEEINNSKT